MAHTYAKRSKVARSVQPTPVEGHTHVDSRGFAHTCYHVSRSLFRSYEFWLGMVIGNLIIGTLQFPLEHWVWEKAPLFRNVTQALGL
jgi:hypothetical protein